MRMHLLAGRLLNSCWRCWSERCCAGGKNSYAPRKKFSVRKRSKYRPKQVVINAWERVIQGSQPISHQFKDALTVLKIKHYSAIDAVKKGRAQKHDVDILIACFNVSEAYAKHGLGAECMDEIALAQKAVRSMVERAQKHKRYGCTGPELNAIAVGIAIHDEQLDNSTVKQLEDMVAFVEKEIAAGRVENLPRVDLHTEKPPVQQH